MENMDKNRIEKMLNKFDEFCAEKINEKNKKKYIEHDTRILQEIGVERLKIALSAMSLTALYDFLHKEGFKGTRARLIDLLSDMEVRAKQAKPERFKNYKCRVKGCDGRLVGSDEDNVYICEKCKNYHKFENRKIVLIKKDVPEKKESENKIPETKTITQKINVPVNQVINNPDVPKQKRNIEKPVEKLVEKTIEKPVEKFVEKPIEKPVANTSKQTKENNTGNAVISGMRLEEETWENK